jgi:sugar lactone lactonase YvrE
VLDYKFRCSNCICFTKSGTTMFFCDTPTRRIYQFDYDARTGPSNRRLLYELPSSVGGGPDGAQCDANGNVWAAISGAGRVIRITPAGEVDLVVELPVKQPTSVTLGGPGMNTLFITTRAENGRKDAGSLFACQVTDTVGVPEAEYRDPSAVNGDALSPTIGPVVPGAVKSSAKFCVNCGVAFEKNGARFCAFCGTARR